eukprot:s1389_g30.t1
MEEVKGVKRPAEDELPTQAGSGMDTDIQEHRKRTLDEESAAEGEMSPSRIRLEPEGSPSSPQKLYPLSFAGNVSRVELWEPDLMVATVQESGDQFLFGADDEEEEFSRDYGEDKDQLISQFCNNADVENAPVVSDDQLHGRVLEVEGYETFLLSPNLYAKKNAKGEVEGAILFHMDDIQLAAMPQEGQRLKAKLEARFSLTTQGPCGPGGSEEAEHFLKRKYEYDASGVTINMGAKYVEKLVQLLGLENKRARATPEAVIEEGSSTELDEARRSNYATAVGMLLYISGDCPDAQHGIRKVASHLVKPTEKQYKQLEHLVCYLKGIAWFAIKLAKTSCGSSVLEPSGEERKEHLLEVFTDSDWAGNKETRKSISSAHLCLNGVLVYALTRTQKSVAMSSCEAEYVAMTTGTSEAVFLKNCIEFLTGQKCRITLRCDSSSARAFCHRQGVGRVRHISCGLLWLQELVQKGEVDVKPVSTRRNTADLSSEIQSKRRIRVLLNLIGFVDTHNDHRPVGVKKRGSRTSRKLWNAKL